jgi:hypothetical protein
LSHGAARGNWTKPFSIYGTIALKRYSFVPTGFSGRAGTPAARSDWIRLWPEAASSTNSGMPRFFATTSNIVLRSSVYCNRSRIRSRI